MKDFSGTGPLRPISRPGSNEMTGLLSRIAVFNSAFMSRGVDGRNISNPATFMNIE
jgi:hypothetical protein